MRRTHNRPAFSSSAPVLAWLVAAALVGGLPARMLAEVRPFSANFKARDMAVTRATLHVRVGGSGPAVLLLHGFGDTGDMWQPLAEILLKDHTVIVPDLRRMGLSSHPEDGYEKNESGSRHLGHPYGAAMKTEVEAIASNVEGAVITNCGHWIMEEQPQQAIAAIVSFLKKEQ